MSEGVKETLCTHCIHREVCAYKQDYLDILKAIEDAIVLRDTPDGKIASKKVNCYDFINRISVSCKYYQNRTEAYYRSREEDEVTARDDLSYLQMKNSITGDDKPYDVFYASEDWRKDYISEDNLP